MAEQATRLEVIDADGHVIEPDVVWKEYAEPAYRDILDRPGGGFVQVTGIQRAYPDMPPDLLGRESGDESEAAWGSADVAGSDSWEEESKLKMGRPGGYDPVARLVRMTGQLRWVCYGIAAWVFCLTGQIAIAIPWRGVP